MFAMLYLLLAELTVLLHFLFVLFVAGGGLTVLRWPRLAWLHLPVLLWGIYIEFSGTICPLTPLEKQFRQLAGMEAYEGGFINHYLMPVIYPIGLSHEIQIIIGTGLIVFNILIYSLVIYRQRRRVNS